MEVMQIMLLVLTGMTIGLILMLSVLIGIVIARLLS